MRYIIACLFILLLMSCKDKWDDALLLGKWKTIEWKEIDSGKIVGNQMDFEFLSDGVYNVDFGKTQTKGKYWIANEYLHTIEEGKVEIKVLIVDLLQDTLRLELNRGGTLESMVLLKQ